jgi:hypothetical protein
MENISIKVTTSDHVLKNIARTDAFIIVQYNHICIDIKYFIGDTRVKTFLYHMLIKVYKQYNLLHSEFNNT